MIVVIQCAARKRENAGYLTRSDGRHVMFVADPLVAPPRDDVVYARPDDVGDSGKSFRSELIGYNESGKNPFNLLPAAKLYSHECYHGVTDRYGIENAYILSAGWGLLSASFLTPCYDITFSAMAEPYKRRRKQDRYLDFCMLPADVDEPIVFFGGKDYLPLFCDLTHHVRSPRIVFYNSANPPSAPNCKLVRFQTTTRTNWHYECVSSVLTGRTSI
jgi:hypothetical protein